MEFLSNVYTVFIQVLILAVLIAVGTMCDRTGIFTEKAARMANDLLFYIITPCVVINSFMTVEYSKENAGGFITAFVCAVIFHIVAALVIMLLYNKGDEDKTRVYKFATMYGNMGYLGLPLSKAVLEAVYGNGALGVFYCSAAVAVFNLFAFTHGVWLMSKSSGKLDIKKILINPGTISVIIGIPLFLLKVKLPDIIMTPVSQLGSMNTPLAMVMFGTYLSRANILEAVKDKNMYITIFFKLILLPLTIICAFRACGIKGDVLTVASVFVSAPTASNTVMFSAKYDRDTAVASEVCGFTTVLSIITMPLAVAFAVFIGN